MARLDQPDNAIHGVNPFPAADDLTLIHFRLSYKRTIRVMCFFLAAGMILLGSGLAGRTLLNRGVSSLLKSELVASEPGSGDKLDKLAGENSVKMVTALVKEDYNGFFDAYSRISYDIYDLIGDPYKKDDDNFVGLLFRSALDREKSADVARNAREKLASQAGSYWVPLRAAVYHREMMIAGAALVVLSLLVIWMKGARFRDLRFGRCWPVLLVFLLSSAAVAASFLIDIRL